MWFSNRAPHEMREVAAHDMPAMRRSIGGVRLSVPNMDIPTWADQNRKMPPGTPFEGRWKTSRAPYFRRIAQKCSPQSNAEFIAVMKAGQMGATAAVVENTIGHSMAVSPRHMLVLTATKGLAEEWSKKRFGPMVKLSGLSHTVTSDTTMSKSFRGGGVLFASYGQTDFFRNSSFPVVIFDEFERASRSVEGNVRKLGEVRTSMYENRRKIIMITTPLELETSKIQPAFDEGTQEYVDIKCPHCKKWIEDFQLLDAAYQIKLEYDTMDEAGRVVDPETVGFRCSHGDCGRLIRTADKYYFFQEGNYRWRKTNPAPRPKSYSFFIDALIAADGGVSFETLAQEWVDALRDPDDMRAYINLRGGRPFEYSEERVDTDDLEARAEAYERGTTPDGALLVTCGGDLHKDRLDVVVVGFDGDTSWSIDWLKFTGDPSMGRTGSLRKFADAFSKRQVPGNPKCAFIDMKYMGDQVLKCAASHRDIFAVGGEQWITGGDSIVESRTEQFGRLPFIRVNTGLYKGWITDSMGVFPTEDGYPEGYMHFPGNYERPFYDQLNSEKRVPEYSKKTGALLKHVWRPFHTMGNHVFDCTVYAWAARDYQLLRIGRVLKLSDYKTDVWAALRDPSHIEVMRQAGAFRQ